MEDKASTLPQYLLQRKDIKDKVAIREKDYGIWQSYTWNVYFDNVEAFALGLVSLGFERGDKVAVIGDNRPQLYWALTAAQCLGGIPVPLYQDAIETELEYILEHAEVKVVVAEDQEQVDKMLVLKEKVQSIETIIYDDPRGLRNYTQPFLMSFSKVQEHGLEFKKGNPQYLEKEIQKGSGEDICLITYTSGTTGHPKGVVLSYSNLISNTKLLHQVEEYGEKDQVMAYLPMAWVGDTIFSLVMSLVEGLEVNCPEKASTVMADMRGIGPTVMFCPPRIWENILSEVQIKMEDANWAMRRMFKFFMNVALRVSKLKMEHKSINIGLRFLQLLGEVLIYGPLRDRLGFSKIRYAYTAGAAIGPEVFQFYRALGINLKQIYGLTESSAMCTYQPDDDVKADTVGKAAPGVEIKIDDRGEVLIKSPGVFQEYYKNPRATAETLKDGWLHSGDAGVIDEDNHLKIIDRAKDISTLSDGTIFAPQYIESKLKFSPYIKEVIALGQAREYVTAMINIDLGTVGNWAERNGLSYTSYTDISQRPQVLDLITNEVQRVNASLFKDEQLRNAQIKKFLILHKELDPDDAEITRTRKVRRGFVSKKYADLIDTLYSDKDTLSVEANITYEDGRVATTRALVKIIEAEVFTEESQGEAAPA